MTRTLALIDNGSVVNVIVGDPARYPDAVDVTDIGIRPSAGWTYDGVVFADPSPQSTPPVALSTRMTQLYFLRRATASERAAIRGARATDPTLDDAMYLFEQARDVDVSLPLAQQLVGYLAQQGYITADRVANLLAPAPVGEDGVL